MGASVKISATQPDTLTLSGHVLAPGGAGLRNATVELADREGNTRRVVTGTFGSFSFDGLKPGAAYTVSVLSKRYRFTPRPVVMAENLVDVDFAAIE